jgi:ATP-dependent exoDNAse (exonuclease V) alpha subunit
VEERREKTLVVHNQSGDRMVFDPSEASIFDAGLFRSLPVAVGERLLLRANVKDHRLFNGNIVEVASVQDDGAIALTDGRTIPPGFRQFSHGYATTSHASQGKTIKRGIVLMTGEGIPAANLKQAYVSHSRFEESHITYTTDQKKAVSAMATPADRDLAIEVANERIRQSRISAKLTEQAEAWAERRQMAMTTRESR